MNDQNKIVGIGYNGFPRGCDDDKLPWAREHDDPAETKYPYVCHAELNAILNKNQADLHGSTIYTVLFPCNECAKLIIQAGIAKVKFFSDKYHDEPSWRAARRMFDLSGVKYEECRPQWKKIEIVFRE